jgi:hypothetical protein
VRQLLETLLEAMPVDKAKLSTKEKAKKRLKLRWTHLLDLDCGQVADLLRDIARDLRKRQEDEKLQKESRSRDEYENEREWIAAQARTPVPISTVPTRGRRGCWRASWACVPRR